MNLLLFKLCFLLSVSLFEVVFSISWNNVLLVLVMFCVLLMMFLVLKFMFSDMCLNRVVLVVSFSEGVGL